MKEIIHYLQYAPQLMNKNWKTITRRGLEVIIGGVGSYLVADWIFDTFSSSFMSNVNEVSAVVNYGRKIANEFYKVAIGCGGAVMVPAIDWYFSRAIKS